MRTRERLSLENPRVQSALTELKGIIRDRWPEATFQASPGEDPKGIYLTATVDVDDTTTVMDALVERLLELQIEERLPVYVVPIHTPERVAEAMRLQQERRAGSVGTVVAQP